MSARARVAGIGVAVLAAACASVETPRLVTWKEGGGYRVDLDRPDEKANKTFVILTFSGGGTRAAAFSYGTLKQLGTDRLGSAPESPHVLDEVDVISSVSGGSFTSAYYGLYGDAIFADYERRFLKVDIEAKLKRRLLNPVNLFRLLSPYFSRIDLAAEYYDEHVFSDERTGAARTEPTYAALAAGRVRPFIIVNATNLANGDRFEFTQSQFDLICADLGPVPVARGVAASSAFPGLLSPITLENRAGTCDYDEKIAAEWVEDALDPAAPDNPARRVQAARRERAYQDAEANRWLHLIDGGVADNIGLRGPMNAISTLDGPWSVLARMNLEEVDRLVVIIVNARTDKPKDLGRHRRTPGLISVLKAAATVPMGKYSFDTVELLKDEVDQFNKDTALAAGCAEPGGGCPPGADFHPVEYYPIHVHFDAEPDPKLRKQLQSIATSFVLDPEEVDLLIEVGGRLLRESREYKRLLSDMR